MGFLLALAAFGCDGLESSPVAPAGTLLTVSANPAAIGPDGTSEITVLARHDSGVPAREGTEVTLATSVGRIDPGVIRTDGNGFARATLHADGRTGQARVIATSGTVTVEVTVSIARLTPQVAFTVETEGLQAIFTDTSSGDPSRWFWELGDGATSRAQNPVHTYAAEGTYVVTLTTGNAAGEASASQFVTIALGEAPAAAFTSEVRGLTAIFTDTSSGDPTSWRWDFGDGATSRAQNPVHTYAASDTYLVRLTVRNASGQESSTSGFVEVP